MTGTPNLTMRRRTGLVALVLAALVGGAGCSRHTEEDLRAMLERWFSLGETVYFDTGAGCTAAMFKVQTDEMKSALRVAGDSGTALFEYNRSGILALSDPEQSPNDGFLELMNVDRPIGIAMQEASILGKDCMDEATESGFFYAMNNPRATLVFLREESSMVLLDPATRLVIFSSGDN